MKILYLQCGLGNQMFQFAYLRYLQSKGYKDLSIDISAPSLHHHNAKTIRAIFPNIKHGDVPFIAKPLGRALHLWNDFLKKGLKINTETQALDGVIESGKRWLRGYWQMAWPAIECRERLLLDFQFPPFDDPENLRLASIIKDCPNSVSLHVRRGDYVEQNGFNTFGCCSTLEYYKIAIATIQSKVKDAHYFIFSDDPQWVRQNFDLPLSTIVDHNLGENSFRDMQLMGLAHHAIIANSSFSWWGAWLAADHEDRIVVAPKQWFVDSTTLFNEQIAPKKWLRI